MTYKEEIPMIREETLSPISESDDEIAKGHGFTERVNYEDMTTSMISRTATPLLDKVKQTQPNFILSKIMKPYFLFLLL